MRLIDWPLKRSNIVPRWQLPMRSPAAGRSTGDGREALKLARQQNDVGLQRQIEAWLRSQNFTSP